MLEAHEHSAMAGVPMLAGNQLMGVIAVAGDPQSRRFDASDVKLLSMFAQQATIAIQNANNYQAALRSADRRRLLYQASLDIGGTLIGMHLKRVAVPVRLTIKQIGAAPIICARTRPKYIGGSRAVYQEM